MTTNDFKDEGLYTITISETTHGLPDVTYHLVRGRLIKKIMNELAADVFELSGAKECQK